MVDREQRDEARRHDLDEDSLDRPEEATPAARHETRADVGEQRGKSAERAPAAQDEDRGGKDDTDEHRRNGRRPWVRVGMVLVLIALIIGGVWYWYSTKDLEDTDDAYTDGRALTIAPHVTGYVVSLDVNDNEFVHKGQPLVHVDPRDYVAARDRAAGQLSAVEGELASATYALAVARVDYPARLIAARAQVASAQANLFRAQTDYVRQHSLPRAATTQQQIDYATAAQQSAVAQLTQAQAQLKQAEPVQPNIEQRAAAVKQLSGQLEQARAQLFQAELDLSRCIVRAPQDGWITKRNVEQGNYVQQGQQLFSIVSPDVWITANFKETQLNRMRPGQHVDISVDAYPELRLHGHVDSVQLGSGSRFTAFPPENATGNFVKIVQRVPVKIVIDSGLDPNIPLPLGISVEPTVDLK